MTAQFDIPRDWTFKDQGVVDAFDLHVREQLPFYDLVAGAVAHIARHYLPHNGRLYDIGASTGNITSLLADTIRTRNIDAISIDNAPEMATKFRGVGRLEIADAVDYVFDTYDVAVLFLTLMFISPYDRDAFLEHLLHMRRRGACVIIVDKIADHSDYFGTVMRRLTLAGKVAAGTSAQDILDKELSLGGIQRPIRKSTLPDNAQEFFRWGEFAGWVIEI